MDGVGGGLKRTSVLFRSMLYMMTGSLDDGSEVSSQHGQCDQS